MAMLRSLVLTLFLCSLQSGTKFTLLWKPTLQNNFQTYCPLCDVTKLDLWITNFNGTKYTSKIGHGLDLTTATSYDWNVNIASTEFSSSAFWVFRFTYFDSADPYAQQISSPGFQISGPVKTLSTTLVPSSSSASAISSSTSLATTSAGQTPVAASSSKDNTWIAGVVAGPVVGIVLGAALMWYCLRKRKNQKKHYDQGITGHQGEHYSEYPPAQDAKEIYTHTAKSVAQPWEDPYHSQHVAEIPESKTPAPPAEL